MGGWWPLVERGSGGGGGGGPLGDATIWPAVADWAGLSSILNPRTGDRAGVLDLGTGNSTGVAQWSGTEWVLVYAMFNSVADLLAFAEPIAVGALAGVEQSASDDETAVRYQWSGSAWERTPAAQPYVWTLASILTLDPSGLGIARDGDIGRINGLVYRLATVPVRSEAGGGTRHMWVLDEIAGGTLESLAYLVGTEDVTTDADLNAQGWPTVTRTVGTITTVADRVQLSTDGGASALVNILPLTSGIGPSSRYYMRFFYRAVTGNQTLDQSTNCTLRLFDGATCHFVAMPASNSVAKGVYFWTGSSDVSAGTDQTGQSAIPDLSATDALVDVVFDVSTNISRVYFDGVLRTASRRSASATADALGFYVNSNASATQTATMQLSHVEVLSW